MKTTTLTLAAVLAATATQAGLLEDVIAELTEQGYTAIEVEDRRGTLKFEAMKDGAQRELIYDKETGALIKDETDGLNDDLDDGSGASGGSSDGSGSGDNSGSGGGGSGGGSGSGGSSGSGNDSASLQSPGFDYLIGGQARDISFG